MLGNHKIKSHLRRCRGVLYLLEDAWLRVCTPFSLRANKSCFPTKVTFLGKQTYETVLYVKMLHCSVTVVGVL